MFSMKRGFERYAAMYNLSMFCHFYNMKTIFAAPDRTCMVHIYAPRKKAPQWCLIRFLVACYATLHPALSVGQSVCWSVGRSVTFYFFYFFYEFYFWTSLLLPKWSGDLKYGPCPPARDFGSRVSGLVFFQSDTLFICIARKLARYVCM